MKFKVKIPHQMFRDRSFNDNTQYDIYVKNEELHRAAAAMRK
ncbi:hypothetical protein [Fictibacillus nanhaiensis]|nr:hypothetical protein [Fictibacillus nanhaiensis]